MEETAEQKATREAEEAAVAEAAAKATADGSNADEEGKVADRPEQNFRAELARKNKEIERLRQEAERNKNEQGQPKRDANDLTTWGDVELKAVRNNPSPEAKQYYDQIDDILLERKVKSIRERERMQEKRALSDLELKTAYPEAQDPSSELSVRMEEILYEYDLQKSPAGRLVAAKIAAAELGKGRSKSTANERKAEADRVARVKGQMVDGDRSKSTGGESPAKKTEEIEKRLKSASLLDASAVSEALAAKGMDRKSFFGK